MEDSKVLIREGYSYDIGLRSQTVLQKHGLFVGGVTATLESKSDLCFSELSVRSIVFEEVRNAYTCRECHP